MKKYETWEQVCAALEPGACELAKKQPKVNDRQVVMIPNWGALKDEFEGRFGTDLNKIPDDKIDKFIDEIRLRWQNSGIM